MRRQEKNDHGAEDSTSIRLDIEARLFDFGRMSLRLQGIKRIDISANSGGRFGILLAEHHHFSHQAVWQCDANASLAVIKLPAGRLYGFFFDCHQFNVRTMSGAYFFHFS